MLKRQNIKKMCLLEGCRKKYYALRLCKEHYLVYIQEYNKKYQKEYRKRPYVKQKKVEYMREYTQKKMVKP